MRENKGERKGKRDGGQRHCYCSAFLASVNDRVSDTVSEHIG